MRMLSFALSLRLRSLCSSAHSLEKLVSRLLYLSLSLPCACSALALTLSALTLSALTLSARSFAQNFIARMLCLARLLFCAVVLSCCSVLHVACSSRCLLTAFNCYLFSLLCSCPVVCCVFRIPLVFPLFWCRPITWVP